MPDLLHYRYRVVDMHQAMFEQTVTLLLSGEFICNVRYPDAWRFLEDEAQRKHVDAFARPARPARPAPGQHAAGRGLVRRLPADRR